MEHEEVRRQTSFYRYDKNWKTIEMLPEDRDEDEGRNRRQVDVKVLDFNWLFENEVSS